MEPFERYGRKRWVAVAIVILWLVVIGIVAFGLMQLNEYLIPPGS